MFIRLPQENESSIPTDSKKVDRDVNFEELFFDYAETENGNNPPYTKRGGTIPTSVILTHSAASLPYNPFNCHIDYLSFTCRIPDDQNQDNYIQDHLEKLPELIPELTLSPEAKGYSGYTSMIRLKRNGLNIGLVAFGGNNGTLFTSLSGQGCVGVDMEKMFALVMSIEAKLTRVDMAHDDLEGVITIKQFKDLYDLGQFKPTTGGPNPSARYIDDMGTGKGCTLYVGNLKNGKELCAYEKGKQLGDLSSPWVRVEGRVSSVDRVIPYDILLKPAEYLAGLYPPLRRLSDKHSLISIIKKHADIALKVMIENAAIAYGKLVNLMSELGHSDSEIVTAIRRDGIPKRVKIPMDAWSAQYVEDDRPYYGAIPLWMRAV